MADYRVNVEVAHQQADFEDQLEYLVAAAIKDLDIKITQGPVVFRVYPPTYG